jgi:hypothetical protein
MSAERDTTRVVRSWLRVDEHESADRVLQIVLGSLDATPQRRSWWPAWRFAHMNTYAKLAMAAAAVVVVAVVGYNLLPNRGGTVGGQPTPTPLVSPSPVPPLPSGSMSAGTYSVTDATLTLFPYTFTVPVGWTGGDGASRGEAGDGNGVRLTTWIITHVYANSCHWTGTLNPVTGKAGLVAALTAQVGHAHSTPVETTIGGMPATKITLSLDTAFDIATCESGIVRLWPDPGPDESGGWPIFPGNTTTVFVIEAKGKVMVLMTVQRKDSPAADVAALQQVLDSVQFQP